MLQSLLRGSSSFAEILVYIVSSLIVVFLTLPIHEFAHGFIATKLGDPTPRYQGRMTLNPFAHIDYIGAACIILFGFGWAKPVQVDARYFKNPKRDMALTALAGPVSNIIVALIAMIIFNFLGLFNIAFTAYLQLFFYYISLINIGLAVFNLIPIPPLDGSKLLAALLPDRQYYKLMRYERYFFFILIALLWTGILDIPLDFLQGVIMRAVQFVAALPFGLF